jgi:hypothetical protein
VQCQTGCRTPRKREMAGQQQSNLILLLIRPFTPSRKSAIKLPLASRATILWPNQ